MNVSWIAVDWGTSNLRIWAMDADNNVLDEKRSDEGMGSLAQADFERVLLSHIEPWLGTDVKSVLACGMVGARQGWLEAPYASVPTKPAAKFVHVETDPRIDVRIIAGVNQLDPADVMRGEETQIAGFLADRPDYQGAVCLPGTHSKWVAIEAGEIKKFQTALTGELFGLIGKNSVLRHSMGEWDDACFVETVREALDRPNEIAMRLFEIRAKNLLNGDSCGISRLSATLIGAEIAAVKSYWQGQVVTIIGAGELARLYGVALEMAGVKADVMKASHLTLAGLCLAKGEIFDA